MSEEKPTVCVRPCRDAVLVEQVDELVPRLSEGGIQFPEISEDVKLHRVLAVGEGEHLPDGRISEPRLRVGDIVILRVLMVPTQGGVQPVNLLVLNRIKRKTALVKESDVWAVVATETH